jgi:DUF4097 and DUF4098 domain-containing protein YvlB
MTIHKRFILPLILGLTISTAFSQREDATTKSKSFTVSKGGTLEVSIDGGDIRIQTWDKNEVAVKVEFSDEEDLDALNISQHGNTIRIEDRNSSGYDEDSRFEISVPVQFNLDVETSSGDIVLKGKLKGNVQGETSAGTIQLSDVDGTIDVHTSGGDVRTGKVTGDARLRTSGGDIDVTSAGSQLDVQTAGGNITLGNVGKSLHASTSGGDVSIGDVGGEAIVATSGGNVTVGKVSGKATLKTSGGDIELHGGKGAIRAQTSGGNVRLENISGSIEANTAGGDIQAELAPGGIGSSRLSSAAGNIWLSVPENAKVTIEARIRIHGRWRDERDSYTIRSDFKAETSGRDDDEREIHAKYVLNGGGEVIMLDTVNSDIEIRKTRSK